MHDMMNELDSTGTHEKLTQELRRGILVLATLSQLRDAKYGYALIEELSSQGLEIDQGTLYPLLRRLEDQGLLESEWNVKGSRPRRYYKLSPIGSNLLQVLKSDWQELVAVLDGLLNESKE
jgi:DNA-binding PadR family transcriptional regulator